MTVSNAEQLTVEIDRCDRKIIEMIGRRAEAVKRLSRHNQMTVRKPNVFDNHPELLSKLPRVCDSYNTPLALASPIFKELLRAFESFEIYGASTHDL